MGKSAERKVMSPEDALSKAVQFLRRRLPAWHICFKDWRDYPRICTTDWETRTVYLDLPEMRKAFAEDTHILYRMGFRTLDEMLVFAIWHEVGHALHFEMLWKKDCMRERGRAEIELERKWEQPIRDGWFPMGRLKEHPRPWRTRRYNRIRAWRARKRDWAMWVIHNNMPLERVANRFAHRVTGLTMRVPPLETVRELYPNLVFPDEVTISAASVAEVPADAGAPVGDGAAVLEAEVC